ncbi:hypothetical protein ACJ73_00787 [Blastomyces percursus]|uniref:DUF2306 domain-containing protein n=1 Tax=Blastomyces percursus TaxID=1658174 RepID=A0A1J9RGY1_9EURO|nr:hypothetical protein ACJ73_00787 [Blastomyces percursus]
MSSWKHIYTRLGFTKSYNALLFSIFATPFFVFALSQAIQFFALNRLPQTIPGERWWQSGRGRLGIFLHLAAVLPCALLSILQLVPAIRHKWPTFHRINGRFSIILFLISNIGALMIADHTFGGTFDMQFMIICLALLPTISGALAYYNICQLQIKKHRAWMLRTMFYAGAILTSRPIIAIGAVFVSTLGTYHNIWPCEMIDFAWREHGARAGAYLAKYPHCSPSLRNGTGSAAIVRANIFSKHDIAEIGASFQIPGSASFMFSLVLHAVGVEIYLALTRKEVSRLRIESYRRQRAAKYINPGFAGLVAESFGDTDPWKYTGKEVLIEIVLNNGNRRSCDRESVNGSSEINDLLLSRP